MTRLTTLLMGLLLMVGASPALADEAPPTDRPAPSSFGAANPTDAPLPEVKAGDLEGLLRNCDIARSRVQAAQQRVRSRCPTCR